MFTTISNLVWSSAVRSMKMFFVLPATIFESVEDQLSPVHSPRLILLTLRVDDGWHGENTIIFIIDDRVSRSIPYQMQEFAQMSILL